MSKRYYGASFQITPLASVTDPLNTAIDINNTYLIKKQTSLDWAQTYLHFGKLNFTRTASYYNKTSLNKQLYLGIYDHASLDHGGINAYYPYSSNILFFYKEKELKERIFADYNIDETTVQSCTFSIFQAQVFEVEYAKASVENYDFASDTIVENGITYRYKTHLFEDINTIKVYFTSEDNTVLEKTIPAYAMTSTDPVVSYYYLCTTISYNTGKIRKILYCLNFREDGGIAFDYKDFHFVGAKYWQMPILPLIPLKKGGSDKALWEDRNYQLVAKRTLKGEDLTGIHGKPSGKTIKKYLDNTKNLYKKCKYPNQIDTYKEYKKIFKKMGLDIRQQISIIYDIMCGFNSGISDDDINKLREYTYDVYAGFMCPLTAIKQTNIIGHVQSIKNGKTRDDIEKEYKEVINKFKTKYPNRPELVDYATYTYYTQDSIFDSEDHI